MVSVFGLLISLIFVLLFKHRIRTIDRETGFQTTTTADYAVEVHGNMPKDATEEELIAHFSDLYALDKPDFRNRPPFEARHKKIIAQFKARVYQSRSKMFST